jgi:hypothetical protein
VTFGVGPSRNHPSAKLVTVGSMLGFTLPGWLEWFYIPLMAPVMLESQFSDRALERAALAADSPSAVATA